MRITRIFLWILASILATIIGLYPVNYWLGSNDYGLLAIKDKQLLANLFWQLAFYVHITGAGIAILFGWLQFYASLRKRSPKLHRSIGKLYVISALSGALAGIYLSFFANGGWIARLGFFVLGMLWLATTLRAFIVIKKAKTSLHEQLMIYSYACCFAAVMLRLFLPFLMNYLDFETSYRIVSWLCWVPNVIVAVFIAHSRKRAASIRVPAT